MGIGKELKRLREEVPISVAKIAQRIGVSADRWRKWEDLDQKPRTEDTMIIEKFFCKSMAEITALKSIKEFLIVPHGTNGESIEKPLPLGDVNITLADYIKILQERFEDARNQQDKYEKLVSGFIQMNADIKKSMKDNQSLASAITEQIEDLAHLLNKEHRVTRKSVVGASAKSEGKTSHKSQKKNLPQGSRDGASHN